MPLPTIPSGNVASAISGAYEVANSCRFNSADSADMTLSMSSGGSTTRFTKSIWVKRAKLGATQYIFDNSGETQIFSMFNSSDQLNFNIYASSAYSTDLKTNQRFRDVSAWYHIVYAVDYTNATQAYRVRIYVNGTEITSWDTETRPGNNTTTFDTWNSSKTHYLGSNAGNSCFDGYLAEVVHIDGLQLTPTSFGEFDEDTPSVFKPIDVSGLTFGTKGHYLDFEDSANLGNDANGGTDWTERNLAAADQATDTPTNNFATMNPLDNSASAATFSEGNLKLAYSGSNGSGVGLTSTFALTKGKWYFEAKLQASNDTGNSFGITDINAHSNAAANRLGVSTYSYVINDSDGKIYNNNDSGTSYGSALDVGDIIGVYLDLDNNKLYISEDGTLGSSTGHSITAASSVSNGHYFFAVGLNSGSGTSTFECNFGGCPAFSISSGNTDDNGYGNFEYSPNITGDSVAKKFYALCTKNLAEYG